MKNIIKLISLITAAAIGISLSACSEDAPHPENELIEYTLTAEPLSLDPQIAADNASILLIKNLFEGLVREREDGRIVPGIAETWDVADNGVKYTFSLCKNTCWSNGDTVTADDFVFGMRRSLDPQTRSESAANLYLIKNAADFASGKKSADELGIRSVDKSTLEITLEYPSDGLLNVLTLPAAMPCSESFFSETKGKYGKEPELLITNGPFCIRENYGWEHNKYIYIRRSENYKAANKAVPLGVNFTIGSAPGDPIGALVSGQTDICEIFGDSLYRANENNLDIETTRNTLWGVYYNTSIKAFKNAKLRVALFGSLDRKELLTDVPDSYLKTSQLISDKVSFGGKNYRKTVGNASLDKAQDPRQMYERALEELAENEISLNPSYTILCLNDETSSRIVSGLIEKWNAVTGCYFNKEALSRSELEQRIKSGSYEIAVAPLNTAIDSPMENLSTFRSDSANNVINLNYPQYDKFIDAAMTASDVDAMMAAMKQAEDYLIEYGYVFPLYYESRYFAYAPGVNGAIFDSSNDVIDFTCVKKIKDN